MRILEYKKKTHLGLFLFIYQASIISSEISAHLAKCYKLIKWLIEAPARSLRMAKIPAVLIPAMTLGKAISAPVFGKVLPVAMVFEVMLPGSETATVLALAFAFALAFESFALDWWLDELEL